MMEQMKRWFRKESRTGRAIMMGQHEARWSKRDFKAFAEEGYRRNVIAYQAINKRADAVASIPLLLFRGDREVTDHPLLRLLEKPNPMQSGTEFRRAWTGFFSIAGNSYLERVMVGRQPRELYTLRPDRMTVKPSDTGFPDGYTYKVGQHTVTWDCGPDGQCDIRHIKTFHPLDDWYGLSPIEAGAYAVDQHNEAMKYMQSLLQNGAMPSGALETKDAQELSDEAFSRMKAEIDEQFGGGRNAGRPMLLEGGLKWSQMSLSPDQIACLDTKYSSARDVSLALGVPPLLLNIPGDSTFNNYREARLAFYEETVIPLAGLFVDELNAWISPLYGDVELRLDLDRIPAIAEKRMELWNMADKSTDLTINERRELKGYEPIPGGDDVLIPATQVPLTFGGDMSGGQNGGEMDTRTMKALAYGKDAPDS